MEDISAYGGPGVMGVEFQSHADLWGHHLVSCMLSEISSGVLIFWLCFNHFFCLRDRFLLFRSFFPFNLLRF